MSRKLQFILLSLFLINQIIAQTGKPQYLIRTERSDTTLGFIKIETFPLIAPKHAAYVDSLVNISFFDTTAFHRVIPDFVIQGGDPNSRHGERNTWGEGDSTQATIPAEFSPAWHNRGTIGAARDEDINSANSQFFINVADNSFLNFNYTLYGQVVSGMDIVDLIVNAPRDENDNPYDKIEMFVTKLDTNFSLPNVPVLISPEDGNQGALSSIRLEWENSDSTILYHIQVALDSNFNSLFYDDSIGFPGITITDIETGLQTYYWRLKSNNGGFKSDYSEVRSFITSISATNLIYPENNSTEIPIEPEIRWTKVNGATSYRMFIATSPTFSSSSIVYDQAGITDTIHTPSGLDGDTKYYWLIRSYTDTYEGPNSSRWNFTTKAAVNVEEFNQVPEAFSLEQNYPNPFNPTTIIRYGLAKESKVNIRVYNLLGEIVEQLVDETQSAGYHYAQFDAKNISSGIYLYSISAISSDGVFSSVKKMILIR